MFCQQCGNNLPINSQFCGHCGAAQQLQQPALPPTSAKKSGMPVWGIILIVLCGLAVVIGILATMAIPAYSDYVRKAKIAGFQMAAKDVLTRLGTTATTVEDALRIVDEIKGNSSPLSQDTSVKISIVDRYSVSVTSPDPVLAGGAFKFTPSRAVNDEIEWSCNQTLAEKMTKQTWCNL